MTVIVGEFTLTHEVPQGLIDDLLCTAFEGGSMWVEKLNVPVYPEGADYASDVISRGGVVYVFADEKETLTLGKFIKGLELYCSEFGKTPAMLGEDHDGDDADCILQYALFGAVVYG